ncbi:MAG: HAD-IIIC family phosphatase [Methylobacter sp.]
MVASKFSWLKAIATARSTLSLSADECLRTLCGQLRTYPLLGFELEMLGRFLRDVSHVDEIAMPVIRVAIVSGYTSDPIANAVRVALLTEGFLAELYEAPFGVYRQEILSPNSALYAFEPKIILVVGAVNNIAGMPTGFMSQSNLELELDREVVQWQSLWAEINKYSAAVILQHTFEIPDVSYRGMAERGASWGVARFISDLNERLIAASSGTVHWVDIDHLATTIGRRNWHDPRLKYHGKLAFSSTFLPEYTTLLKGTLMPVLGRTRKALIVDLDNTLWGGVIGDDGIEGVRLGPDTPDGEAYQAFCRYVGELGRRGVILGICSKNEMANVVEIFEKHRHMPLRLDDFAVLRCNWDDKASNLAAIAHELNIDVSALVFVDDNPAECDLVCQSLPAIHVVQMDGDPAFFVRRLDSEHLFDSQVYSAEDIKRSASYQARAKSESLRSTATDLNGYLSSLQMVGEVWQAREEDISRLAQMEAKTNQFNLTTRRWSSDQIRNFMADDNYDVLCFRLIDRFADHGLVGSMVVCYQSDEAQILSWLLSCRVFSRTCEEFMLLNLKRLAIGRGVSRIRGEFIATAKNQVVETLFSRLGFCAGGKDESFVMDISDATLPKSFVTLIAGQQ